MHISRRDFLRSTATAPLLLAGCRESASQTPPVAPPAWAGRVASARNSAVWQKGVLSPEALGEMLDACVTTLTKEAETRKAWAAICKPGDRVAIKVNAIIHGSTHVPLVAAVAERLQTAGVKPDRIVVYDRTSDELRNAGFAVATSGERVRCHGTEGDYIGEWSVAGSRVRLSRLLSECDTLINIPVLKAFSIGGLSFALKNHYGSFDIPHRFHGNAFTPGVVALNALAPIHARTRLIVGDVLAPEVRADATDYAVIGGHHTLLVATDPVAIDRAGLQLALASLKNATRDPRSVEDWANRWLAEGERGGLGVGHVDRVRVAQVKT